MAAFSKIAFLCLVLPAAHGAWLEASVSAQDSASDFDRLARIAAPRDGFPVFNNPKLVPAARATQVGEDDWVIGVAINKESKAYPITVMGTHELGNDTCGGEPIAISW